MVVIRLARGGAKKRPFYHLVVTDKRSRRDSRYIERVGYFNPCARGAEAPLFIKLDRVEYWRSVGAQTSDRVGRLLHKFARGESVVKPAVVRPAANSSVDNKVEQARPVADDAGAAIVDSSVADTVEESAVEEKSAEQEESVAEESPQADESAKTDDEEAK